MEQREGRAGIAVSSLVTSFVVAQGCRDKETPVAEARGRRGQGFDEPESIKSIVKTKSDEMKRKKRKEKAEIEEWRGAEKGFVLYITVLKGKFKGF